MEEGLDGKEMMGKNKEKENSKPAVETYEDTELYSNVKAVMGVE